MSWPKSLVKREEMGAKARHLADLSELGFPVPAGFVIQSVTEVAAAIGAVREMGGYPVAVRSSGALEDLADASFAGMYETILGVASDEELGAAISRCFDSVNSDRVRDYLKSKNLAFTNVDLQRSMRVLIQPMVAAERAGVLFTIDPVLGLEEECYSEVCRGLGERLVSGQVTPSRYRWNWHTNTLTLAEVNAEGTMLSDEERAQLSQLGLKIQAHYGHPQDIEWAIDHQGKLWVLQSRPVTQVAWRQDIPELTNADLRDGGISARACPPMMFSLYQDAMQISMARYLMSVGLLANAENVQWMYSFYGRAYWNVEAVKQALAQLPGFDERQFDQGLGIQKDYGASGPLRSRLTPVTLLKALRALCGVSWEYQDCLRMVDHFANWFESRDRELKDTVGRISVLSDQEFWQLTQAVYDFHFRTETSYFRTIYNNSNYQSDFRTKLRQIDAAEAIDVLQLLSGLDGVAHMRVQAGLEQLAEVARRYGTSCPRWQKGLTQFLEEHYHHADAELDLRTPRWGEHPQRVVELVQDLLAAPSPRATNQHGWLHEWQRLEELHGPRPRLRRMLVTAREFLLKREQMRSYSTRAYYLWRMIILEAARRLGRDESELHLWRAQELLRRQHPGTGELARRRDLLRGYAHFKAPNEFGGGSTHVQKVTDGLQGIGCSSGVIEGVVRVINNLSEAQTLQSGEILVTKFTDPGWTPAMARAAAVVTEVGGVLSHAAVIGREYGIPAVLNVADATVLLKTGERVRVDGRSGKITRLEEKP